MAVTLEQLLDKIASEIIQSDVVNPSVVEENQKTIRRGTIQVGRTDDERLVLYQRDVNANQQDLLSTITLETPDGEEGIITELQFVANSINDINQVTLFITNNGSNGYNITLDEAGNDDLTSYPLSDVLFNQIYDSDGVRQITNALNVSQFIPISRVSSIVDVEKAEEFLDTNIFELLPTGDTRQARLIRFFEELNALLPPEPGDGGQPPFDFPDGDDNDFVDRAADGTWISASLFDQNTSISYAQDNDDGNIDEEDAFIHRLKSTANSINSSRTIQDIYNRILPYLTDILEDPAELIDDRPEYENQSSGYLKFRNLNQGIIIRNTNQDFVQGLDPNNPTYLSTGFTITMWVRFFDKVSEGTLFNFGNPLRENNPLGFSLETYVINADDIPSPSGFTADGGNGGKTWGQIFRDGGDDGTITYENGVTDVGQGFFSESNTERFVRLIVREQNDDGTVGKLRDSHLGAPWMMRYPNTPQLGFNHSPNDDDFSHHFGLMKNTRIPEDFNEWYFICATYNPNVNEEYGFTNNQIGNYSDVRFEPNFWLNHIDVNGQFTNFSQLGNRCKVEIISRSDLLRAQGFKV